MSKYRRTKMVLACAVTAALGLAGAVSITGFALLPNSDSGQGNSQGHGHKSQAIDHFFVIMLENHSKNSVINDPNAPYITSLAHTYGMADNYFGVTHPSMPNYVASIGGDTFGIQDDEDENVVNLDQRNVVDQLESHGKTWGAYMQTLPDNKLDRFGPVVDGTAVHLYAKKHNAFTLFDDIKNSPARMANVKPYEQLSSDLKNARTVPDFVWITPNQCSDMHGGVNVAVPGHPETPCPYAGEYPSGFNDVNDVGLKQKADAFVHQTVQAIMASPVWKQNSAIFIVTDEDDYPGTAATAPTGGWESPAGCCDSPYVVAHDKRMNPNWPTDTADSTWPGGTLGGGNIPAIVVTSHGPRGYVSHTPYNHYSMLRTIEDNWNLGYLRYSGDTAGGVLPMNDLLFTANRKH